MQRATLAAPFERAVSLCDSFLIDIGSQSIVEQHRVVDFILDLRSIMKEGVEVDA